MRIVEGGGGTWTVTLPGSTVRGNEPHGNGGIRESSWPGTRKRKDKLRPSRDNLHLPGGSAWPDFSFAYQPVVDTISRKPYSYEALIRGREQQSAFHLLNAVPREELHQFDAAARLVAIELAARCGLSCKLNLNSLPMSLLVRPPSETIEAVARSGLNNSQCILEVTEDEMIGDHTRFAEVIGVLPRKRF